MRIVVFVVTLFLGIYAASFFKPSTAQMPCSGSNYYRADVGKPYIQTMKTVPFDSRNNYTKQEAVALIGKQVSNLSGLNAKCPKESGDCLNLLIGETGKVVGIIPSMNDTYMLEILWDQNSDGSNANYVSYVGKELAFKIIN